MMAGVDKMEVTLILVSVLGLLVLTGMIFLIATRFSRPIVAISQAAGEIANGNLNVHLKVNQNDEIGRMAQDFQRMIAYVTDVADKAQKIAGGDLTIEVTPLSKEDVLGNAFLQMLANLRTLVGKVKENTAGVGTASAQLASAANQAGQATSQIATTIQQVAKGTAQQAESVTRTASSVEQMNQAIEGVAKGAMEQSRAMTRAGQLVSQISTAIQQVSESAKVGATGSSKAAQAAEGGAQTVYTSIQGMQAIQSKVNLSAQKVQEMGNRSMQIGVIVETIDDIASQTNLLALNAAIEAARAGEHGKGFAVVADEVRKLAERASNSTKEIGGLVRDIQNTVAEAVAAMNEGSSEVEQGVTQASLAGKALEEILQTTQMVNQQVSAIADAAKQMSGLSNELITAADAVSAVVEKNTAATGEMSAASKEVTQSIENIASVSEENSASVEEVSASAEEMSAQVEEVTASAASLAEMAQALQGVVAQFKLTEQHLN
jgi:methyl-accepting chemotaxis protein